MKVYLGILGEKGGGKGTFTQLLAQVSSHSTISIKSSDLLGETLDHWNIPRTRHNLQQLAITMCAAYGEDTLTKAMKERMLKAKEDIVMFEGVRWHSDVEMIKSLPNSFTVYITAPAEVRYQRSKLRKEKVGEDVATFEQFMEEELVATETQIKELGKKADFIIDNSGTEEEYKKKIEEICAKMGI